MKRFPIILLLLLLSLSAGAQSIQTDTVPPDSTVTLTNLSLSVTIDTTLEAPSYYLTQAAKAQKFEFASFAVGGCFAILGAVTVNQESNFNDAYPTNPNTISKFSPLYAVAGLCGILGIVNHFVAIGNINKAGKSLSRFHIQGNGLTIDF